MMDKKIKEMSGKKDLEDMNLEELDELEDEEDERILMEYRNQRLAEMKALQERSKYGEVKEITAPEYVKEVSERSVIFHEFSDYSVGYGKAWQFSLTTKVRSPCLAIWQLSFADDIINF